PAPRLLRAPVLEVRANRQDRAELALAGLRLPHLVGVLSTAVGIWCVLRTAAAGGRSGLYRDRRLARRFERHLVARCSAVRMASSGHRGERFREHVLLSPHPRAGPAGRAKLALARNGGATAHESRRDRSGIGSAPWRRCTAVRREPRRCAPAD